MTEQPGIPQRKATMAPFIAAVAVIVVIVATVLFWPHGQNKKTLQSMACPKTFPASSATWVPKKAGTSNPGKALAPSGLPEKAVICGYVHGSSGAAALTGSKSLHGDPRAVVTTLRDVPKATGIPYCTGDALGDAGDRYLLALSYTGQVIWVSLPRDRCAGTSNGTFEGRTNLGADASQALQYGVWPTDPDVTGACSADVSKTAPATLPSAVSFATICLQRSDKLTHAYRYNSLASDVITGYNGYASATSTQTCPKPTSGKLVAIVKGADGKTRVITGSSTCLDGSGGVHLTGAQAANVYKSFTAVVNES